MKENFSNYLAGYSGNSTNKNQSTSFVNESNDNLYNSIYCPNLSPKSKGFIKKNNMRFSGELDEINPCFINASNLKNAVELGNIGIGPWGRCPGFLDQSAKWIYFMPGATRSAPGSNFGPITFLYDWNNDSGSNIPIKVNVIADNQALVYINNQYIGKQDGGWGGRGGIFNGNLNLGKNSIKIIARNFSPNPNPAGLLATIVRRNNNQVLFSTNRNWKYMLDSPLNTKITSAQACRDAGGGPYAYCSATNTHYCCNVCTEVATCSSNGGLKYCACQNPNANTKKKNCESSINLDTEGKCLNECKSNLYCAAYEFDKPNKKCKLYSNFPNSHNELPNYNIGYKITSGFDFNKLNQGQQKNVIKRCGSQWLSQKYDINGNNINKCLSPVMNNNKISGFNTDAKCLWDTLSNTPQNNKIKNTKRDNTYLGSSLMSSVPNSDIDKDIRNFYKKIDNNVIFSNLNNKEILNNNSGDAQFEGNLLNAVNSYYDENQSFDADKLANEISARVGVQENFQNIINNNNNNTRYMYFILLLVILIIIFLYINC